MDKIEKEKLQTDFYEASEKKDIGRIQEIMDSGLASDLDFHKDVWKKATEYCSPEQTAAAFHRLKKKIRPLAGRKWLIASTIFSMAACLLLGVNIWINCQETPQPVPEDIQWKEYVAEACEIKEITLPDSTHIWLNSQSRIIYPERFTGKERKVFLEGEAFFEVAKDTLHPFIAQSGENKVIVTGTSFNLKTYGEQFITTLVEGRVNVSVCGSGYLLKPGEVLAGNTKDGTVCVSEISQSKYPRWFKGEINIYNEPLSVIAEDLERRFGVKIIIRNSRLAHERFSISFVNGEDLDEIMAALSVVNSMKIIRKDKIIDIL